MKSPVVFEVYPAADFGIRSVYLDEDGLRHILLGHRDLRSFVTGIQQTVASPTHVYQSSYHSKRLQFVSQEVTSAHGHHMNVVIELDELRGRVITATPKSKITGEIVWDVNSGVYTSYDKRSDILYFSTGNSDPSYVVDDGFDDRVWYRRRESDESASGVTIFDAQSLARSQTERLVRSIAEFLSVGPAIVGDKLRRAVMTFTKTD